MNQPATKVLVIGYVWPEPRSSAASGHVMQILEVFLEQGWDITFSSPAGFGEQRADLTALGIREVPIELNNSIAESWANQAIVYERRGDKARAAKSFSHALSLDPKYEPAKQGLARTRGSS